MKNTKYILFLLLLLFAPLGIQLSIAQEKHKKFRDPEDHAFDLSMWLLDLHGFIPLVVPITEPALGYGATAAGIYFVPKEKEPGKFKLPDIVGAGAGYTQSGSWFVAGAYAGFWKDDRIRYRGVAGYGDINLKFYGPLSDVSGSNGLRVNIQSFFFLQQGLFRIKKSDFLLGGKYVFAKTHVNLPDFDPIFIDPLELEMITSGIGLIGEYESFNNVLSPSKGLRVHLEYTEFLEFLGSDRNSGKATLFSIGYIPIVQRWNSGLRFETNLATESTPFYMKPYLVLRGVPVFRYQGDWTLLAETEQFVNVYKRWSGVAFGGYGVTYDMKESLEKASSAWNAGLGFRYMIARAMKLQMGLDVARGPEDWAFYIVFGSAWLK